jgi:hypothetical protein
VELGPEEEEAVALSAKGFEDLVDGLVVVVKRREDDKGDDAADDVHGVA